MPSDLSREPRDGNAHVCIDDVQRTPTRDQPYASLPPQTPNSNTTTTPTSSNAYSKPLTAPNTHAPQSSSFPSPFALPPNPNIPINIPPSEPVPQSASRSARPVTPQLTTRRIRLAISLDFRPAAAALALRDGVEDGGDVRAAAVPGLAVWGCE